MRKLAKRITPFLLVVLLLTGCISPPSGAQVEPQAGQWQTWVVSDVATLRPSAPPDPATTRQELQELKTLSAQQDVATRGQVK